MGDLYSLEIQHTCMSADPRYDLLTSSAYGTNVTGSLFIKVSDNDVAACPLSKFTVVVTEDGLRVESYKLVLESAPTSPVSIEILPRDGKGIRTSTAELTFNHSNWAQSQEVFVYGRPTEENQPRKSTKDVIDHVARSHDPLYSGMRIDSIIVTVVKRASDLDVTPAPELRSIVHSNVAYEVLLTFDRPCYVPSGRFGKSEPIDCLLIFTYATYVDADLEHSICYFSDPFTLHVVEGDGQTSSIPVGTRMTLRSGGIRATNTSVVYSQGYDFVAPRIPPRMKRAWFTDDASGILVEFEGSCWRASVTKSPKIRKEYCAMWYSMRQR